MHKRNKRPRKEKGICPLQKPMEPNQTERPNRQRPQRRKIPPRDLIIIAVGVFIIFLIPWNNMNSFHYLLLFLFVLCIMLRWSNMRKEHERQEAEARRKAAQAALQPAPTEPAEAAETPAEAPEAPAAEGAAEPPATESTEPRA